MHVKRAIAAFAILLSFASVQTLASDWTNPASGLYTDAGNWSAGVPNAAGAVADFSTLNFSGDISVTVNGISPTVGTLDFGDTDNAGSSTSWEFRTDDATIPVLTLDNSGSTPVVNVDPLGVTGGGFDDAFIALDVAGSNGFQKTGDGILTLGGNNTGLAGTIDVSGGTLRFDGAASYDRFASPITLADNTTLTLNGGGIGEVLDVSVAAGGTATMNVNGNTFLSDVYAQGAGSTLNLNLGSGVTATAEDPWSSGSQFAVVNMTGTGANAGFFRGRFNGGGWTPDAFTSSEVNLSNISFFLRVFSNGNTVTIGALNGDASSTLSGSDVGGPARYEIGGLNLNSTFAGTVDGNESGTIGTESMTINKVGTGTHTFSGTFVDDMIQETGDIGRQGGVIRVTEGTLALANTATSIPGGPSAAFKTTIDIKAAGTFDVSGANTTFTTSAHQQVQGAGTIVGPINFAADTDILAGNVSQVDNDSDLTNLSVATAGTLNITGDAEIAGATIVYDMNSTPGGDDLVAVSGTATLTSGTVQTTFLGSAPAGGQTYTVLTAGTFAGAAANLTVNYPGRAPDPTLFIAGNNLQFTTPAPVIANLVWTGSTDGNWDIETTQNWDNGGADVYFDGDNVRFDDTNTSGNNDVTIVGSVVPSSVTVDSSTNNYSIGGGTIGGVATTLTKSGSSTLTLTTGNTYGGGTTINGGVIDLSDTGTAGTGTITLAGGELHRRNGSVANNIEVSASTTNVYRNLGGADGMTTVATNIDGQISGSGRLEFANDTTVIQAIDLRGDNSAFTGEAAVTGTSPFALRWRDSIGAAGTNVAWDLGDNGSIFGKVIEGDVTFQFGSLSGGASSTPGSPTATLRAQFSGGGSGGATYEIGGLDTSTTFGGLIEDSNNGAAQGATSITKVGSGTLTLTYDNTYSGDTSVEEGKLSITEDYLADTADVYLTTGATLDLDFGSLLTIDTIDALFFDGASQAVGTWGRIGSGADNESSFFTGDGLLMVSTLEALAGDFDNSGFVDGTDFLAWQQNTAVGSLQDWQDNYGTGSNALANTSAVPEPGAALLIVCGLTGLLTLRRKSA